MAIRNPPEKRCRVVYLLSITLKTSQEFPTGYVLAMLTANPNNYS